MNGAAERVDEFLKPARLWRRSEVLTRPSPVPQRRGLYAWFFRALPPGVPATDVHTVAGWSLLYIGIAPSTDVSRSTLRWRLRTHFRQTVFQSTLRMTLASLLARELNLQLFETVSKRPSLGPDGEARLSDWLQANAAVTWVVHEQPWALEQRWIEQFKTPLNLQGNRAHPFFAALSERRRAFKAAAGPALDLPDQF